MSPMDGTPRRPEADVVGKTRLSVSSCKAVIHFRPAVRLLQMTGSSAPRGLGIVYHISWLLIG